jgi:6-phosphogluconolactonase (cycloisomerase 2 family)
MAVDPSGRFLYAANYYDYTLSAYAIDAASGALQQLPGSPYATGPQPQAVRIEPTGRFLYVGLNEFQIDAVTGKLTPLPQTAPSPFGGPSDITADPAGKFLYFAHQGEARVSQYAIDPGSGQLTYLGATTPPQTSAAVSLCVEPAGKYVVTDIGQFTLGQTINSFEIDPLTGMLPTNPTMTLPTAGFNFFYLTIDPSGKYIYVADQGNYPSVTGKIWGFGLDAATGKLSLISATPWAAGTGTASVAVTGRIQ